MTLTTHSPYHYLRQPLNALTAVPSFLQIISVPKSGGGTVTNYSPRFTLSGMTGSFPAAIKTAAQGVTGTAGPATQNAVVAAGGDQASVSNIPQGSYAIKYADQDGPTKYAPMQGRPGTKITAKTASARYPTSSVSYYHTFAPIPKQVTTQTMSQTFTVSSVENQVCLGYPGWCECLG